MDLANLKVASEVEIVTENQIILEEPHLTLIKSYLIAKLANKIIRKGQNLTTTIKGK
jgi:hypothetical protein